MSRPYLQGYTHTHTHKCVFGQKVRNEDKSYWVNTVSRFMMIKLVIQVCSSPIYMLENKPLPGPVLWLFYIKQNIHNILNPGHLGHQ